MNESAASESPSGLVLSVIIPAYNEAATIDRILAEVLRVDIDKEVIVVDDHSTDGTRERLQAITPSDARVRAIYHDKNRGKGAALRTGFAHAMGRFVLVQDADLEYDPAEYPRLLRPLLDGRADVVYGSRFVGDDSRRVLYFWHLIGNRFLTLVSNMLTNINLTDMETCFKVFRREIIQNIRLEENGFGFEPEVTAKVAAYRLNGESLRIYEVGISYHGRTYAEGKKINWRDGLKALWCILRYNLFKT